MRSKLLKKINSLTFFVRKEEDTLDNLEEDLTAVEDLRLQTPN